AGDRQYGRVSIFPNMTVGRMGFGLLSDQQIAAVPTGVDGEVDTHYLSTSGGLFGFSLTDPGGRLYLGASMGFLDLKDVDGTIKYSDMASRSTRKDAIADLTNTYSGTPINTGMIWRMGKTAKPAIAVVVHDVGDTVYTHK